MGTFVPSTSESVWARRMWRTLQSSCVREVPASDRDLVPPSNSMIGVDAHLGGLMAKTDRFVRHGARRKIDTPSINGNSSSLILRFSPWYDCDGNMLLRYNGNRLLSPRSWPVPQKIFIRHGKRNVKAASTRIMTRATATPMIRCLDGEFHLRYTDKKETTSSCRSAAHRTTGQSTARNQITCTA
jgi:hypothetical protein